MGVLRGENIDTTMYNGIKSILLTQSIQELPQQLSRQLALFQIKPVYPRYSTTSLRSRDTLERHVPGIPHGNTTHTERILHLS